MRTRLASLACAALVLTAMTVGFASVASAAFGATATERRLVFAEEFSASQVDWSVWQDQMSWGHHTTGELQYYTADSLVMNDGQLSLTARQRPYNGYSYTSGVVATFDRFNFTYGRAEIRARVPRGQGYFPAFWLAPQDKSVRAEIDVMEILGQEPDRVYMTMHYTTEDGRHYEPGNAWKGPDFSAGYHTFAVDWQPGSVVWYVDGVERARQTVGVPSTSMYLIANLAIGGPWPGAPDATTPFPGTFDIDYIRVYQDVAVEDPVDEQPHREPMGTAKRTARPGSVRKPAKVDVASKRLGVRPLRVYATAIPGRSGDRGAHLNRTRPSSSGPSGAPPASYLWIYAPHWMR